jgi:hypothetical protein
MTDPDPYLPDDYARQAAALIGLTLSPVQLPGVQRNLTVAASMAAAVFAVPLGRDDHPAPAFHPDGGTGSTPPEAA